MFEWIKKTTLSLSSNKLVYYVICSTRGFKGPGWRLIDRVFPLAPHTFDKHEPSQHSSLLGSLLAESSAGVLGDTDRLCLPGYLVHHLQLPGRLSVRRATLERKLGEWFVAGLC